MVHSRLREFPLFLLVLASSGFLSQACEEEFEGFGIFLGSMAHLSGSPKSLVSKVIHQTYQDLGIRHYRTSYESTFSPSRDVYEISCSKPDICSYIDIHHEIAKYANISLIASIWSPPHYMKNNVLHTLKIEEEWNYYHFIKNITQLMKSQFNLTIERISPINEPENIFAPWEHTNMIPQQLCRMVHDFNDSLISICPENSYYWISEIYANVPLLPATCLESCEIFGTHAYALHLGNDEDNMLAYYDKMKYSRRTAMKGKPIYMTEVSSTYYRSEERQMEEAIDLAVNIVNLVGHTCIQRYYFWYAYTAYASGESIMWGDENGNLIFPKKYYAFKHFTRAASGKKLKIRECGHDANDGVQCLLFGHEKAVFVNTAEKRERIELDFECEKHSFCCTNEKHDWNCATAKGTKTSTMTIPAQSICSCSILLRR